MIRLLIISLIVLCTCPAMNGFQLQREFSGHRFFEAFNFTVFKDENMEYVNRTTAFADGLVGVRDDNTVFMKLDNADVVPAGGSRRSVQIISWESFADGLFILDLVHMPTGCGTWPAFWLCGETWPNDGEIDIIEGVNNQQLVQTTLHTSQGCSMKNESPSEFTGHWTTGLHGQNATDCWVQDPQQGYNQGCSILADSDETYGTQFNRIGGGVFATLWDPHQGLAMWFFPRYRIPSDIVSGNPVPTRWGVPYARFDFSTTCASSNFQPQQVIFDLALCGQWAGAVFEQMCPGLGDCVGYVNANPEKLAEAYWLVNYLKIYSLD